MCFLLLLVFPSSLIHTTHPEIVLIPVQLIIIIIVLRNRKQTGVKNVLSAPLLLHT